MSPFLDFLWLDSKSLPVGFTIVPTALVSFLLPDFITGSIHSASVHLAGAGVILEGMKESQTVHDKGVPSCAWTQLGGEQSRPPHTGPTQSPVNKGLMSSLYSKGTSVLGRLSHTHGQLTGNQQASKLDLDQISERRASYTYSP